MRKPNETEVKELTEFYMNHYGIDAEDVCLNAENVGVIETYMSESPGYAGKIILCIFAYPELHDVFKYNSDGNLQIVEKEQ